MGRVLERPVDPHPDCCQLAFDFEHIGVVLLWLVLNRNGLVVFLHSNTGDDLKDHAEYAIRVEGVPPAEVVAF
ncbi:Aromatic ring-cleaving dioxygenase [Pseudomonas chlororaphis subsp. aurantiaca]|nr:Aromatic ring-cleaving dioxygenase [Pseudomonas chlororaphis subsp. aurantiaca]